MERIVKRESLFMAVVCCDLLSPNSAQLLSGVPTPYMHAEQLIHLLKAACITAAAKLLTTK